ncbi:hypothetical protein QFC21_006015 [Naganishia friedmannii]|uniref:Uncharacterized protein n=1 Tax=Naganishia friedmannii TaxID=89922 RepID=A0ACC2V602_9TREE|nr:hypothetical protein QFC21_006015 [Naganishia friedmannii]
MSFFKSRSAPSSRRSSSASLLGKPTSSEIFTSPAPGYGPKAERTYNPEQKALASTLCFIIEELRKYAFTLLLPESDPYNAWEKRFLSDPGCCPRYMRAAKWKLDNAKERIKGTLEWRRDYKPELIQESDVSPEAETGKIERAIDFMPPSVETVMIIVDYASATSQSNPSITTARQVLNILQNHYVERMGRAIVVNMPYVVRTHLFMTSADVLYALNRWWVNAFFTAITPFLDPVTKEKMRFNPKLPELVPVSQLDVEAPDGGRLDKNGHHCIPPAGNGARAAFESGGSLATEARTSEQSPAAHAGASDVSDLQTDASPSGLVTASTVTKSDERAVDNAGLHSSMQGLAMQDNPASAVNPVVSNLTGDSRSITTFDSAHDSLSIEEIPAVPTAQGPPAGAVVFDHPPTEKEILQAEALT